MKMSKNVLHSVKNPPISPTAPGAPKPHPAANTAKVSPEPAVPPPGLATPSSKKEKTAPGKSPPVQINVTGPEEKPQKRWSITPTKRSQDSSLNTNKKSDMDGMSSVRHNQKTSQQPSILPDVAAFEDAPELAHLKLMRSKALQRPGSTEEPEDINLTSDQPAINRKRYSKSTSKSKSNCCSTCFAFLRKCCGCAPYYDELDNLDPVRARTRHSLEFIKHLALLDLYARQSNSGISQPSITSTASNDKANATTHDQKLKRKAYGAIYEGLIHLQEVHHRYKQLILLLTFTRYAEDPLDDVELDLSHSRTVLGSYIWLASYILEQAQYDNDVIYTGYPAGDVEIIMKSLERIVAQSVTIWKACVRTIENVEQIHEHVARVFTALVSKFAKEEDKEIQKSRHIRVHSNYQRRAAELDKLKVEYDTRNGYGEGGLHSTMARFSLAPLRILYKDVEKSTTDSWRGFELLSQEKKFGLLKIMINDAGRIWAAVLEQLELIAKLLKTHVHGHPPKNPTAVGGIDSFEDGVIQMQKHLEQLEATKWNKQEISEFLEVEKITIDNLDLLTLGTATLRTLLHDGRHIVHICYEMTREMDYIECRQMSVYEDVVSRTLNEFEGDDHLLSSKKGQNRKESLAPTITSSSADISGHNKKKKRSVFDIEERNLDRKEVEILFDRSIYQDIIKELPVFTHNLSIGLTLQEAEAVFTESSHDMLNSLVIHL